MGDVYCLRCSNQGGVVVPVEGGGAKVSPCPDCPAGEKWSEHIVKLYPKAVDPVLFLPAPTKVNAGTAPLLGNIDLSTAWKGLLETGIIETNCKPIIQGLSILAQEHELDYYLGLPVFEKRPTKGFRLIRLRRYQPVLAI